MKTTKRLGIWMDHANAHVMALTKDTIVRNMIKSQSGPHREIENLRLDESLMHNREQNQLSDFFKKLTDVIKDYDDVLLFGPTEAKNELSNLLKDDRHFEKIKIEVQTADKMTKNQEEDFVKEYFNASE